MTMEPELAERLADLKHRVIAAKDQCDALEGDIKILQAAVAGKEAEYAKLQLLARAVHHDHQSVRSLVNILLEELEMLVPRQK